jgi:hypothetical protein
MLDVLALTASSRKLRLFACACCRRLNGLFPNALIGRLVEIAERDADGAAELEDLEKADAAVSFWLASQQRGAASAAHTLTLAAPSTRSERTAVHVTHAIIQRRLRNSLRLADETCRRVVLCVHAAANNREAINRAPASGVIAIARATWRAAAKARLAECRAQAAILRDVFNVPIRRNDGPHWLTPDIRYLAAVIYRDYAFERLPTIADALEDRGCSDAELLGHLRGPGPHVRGCWAVDLVLGKR